jgi:hypothetical protein
MTTVDGSNQISLNSARSEDARVVELLIAAAEFANFAMDRLIRQLDDDREQLRKLFYDYVSLVHTLEVTFLFPNLTSRERDLLVALMGARNALLLGRNGLRQWRTECQRTEHKAVLQDLQSRFVLLRSEIVAAQLQERLSPVQRRLLEQEFLAVPGLHTGQTGFFSRAGMGSMPPALDSTIPEAPRFGAVCFSPAFSGDAHRGVNRRYAHEESDLGFGG